MQYRKSGRTGIDVSVPGLEAVEKVYQRYPVPAP
jgi:hypothetical protein